MSTDWEALAEVLKKRISRRAALQAMAGAGAGMIVTGCTTETAKPAVQPTPPAASTTPATGTTPAAQPTAAPKRGGRLQTYSAVQAPNLDPMLSVSYQTHNRISLIYNKLVKLVRGAADPYKTDIVPDLAEKWDSSSDGLTWNFYLRKGVKWAKVAPMNGRELTADDVVYTMQRNVSPEAPNKARYVMLDKVEKVDQYTVRFKLKYPHPQFLFNLGAEPSEIVPKEAVEKEGDLKNWMAGSGPFVMSKYEPAMAAIYDKNPDYFEADKIYIDGIDHMVIADKANAIAAFRAGKLDGLGWPITGMHALKKSDVDAIKKTNPNTKVYEYLGNGVNCTMGIRFGVKPFDDLRVRKAINHAFDRDVFIAAMAEGEGTYVGTFPFHTFPEYAFPMDELKKLLKYDPALSKQLLAEAGYPNGFTAKLMWRGENRQVVDIFIDMLKQVGITLDLSTEQVDYVGWVSKTFNAQYTHLSEWGYAVGGIWDYIYGFHHTEGNRQGPGTKIPAIDAKIDEALRTLDKDKLYKMVQEIERWALTEGLYIIPIYTAKSYMLTQPWVENLNAGYGSLAGVYTMDWMAGVRLNK